MGFFSAICSGLGRGVSKSFVKPVCSGGKYHRSTGLGRSMNKSSVGHRATYHKRRKHRW